MRWVRFIRSADSPLSLPWFYCDYCESKGGAGKNIEKILALENQRVKFLAYCDVVANMPLEALNTVTADDEPNLQRAESSTKWDLPVSVVCYKSRVRE
jgi:hypothetical protein